MSKDEINVGQDAFLDVFANLVGILIILVVVIGAQATVAWQTPADQDDHQAEMDQLSELKTRKQDEFKSLRLENQELKSKLAEEEAINDRLEMIRHQILVATESRRRALQKRKLAMNELQRASLMAAGEVQELENRIRQVRYEASAVKQNLEPEVKTIPHYPTPIARTVFSDEVHFRIRNGKIVYVPLDELVNLMKQSWQNQRDRIRRATSLSQVVGPIDNFELRYLTETIRHPQLGSAVGVQMKRFELLPVRGQLGEDVETALSAQSKFQNRVSRLVPHKTTISLWVYPDSYDDLEKIQEWLRQSGFQTACWPLKHDGLISGGPRGFRTSTN